MKLANNRNTLFFRIATAVWLTFASSYAIADNSRYNETLKNCVIEHLDTVRASSNPTANAIMKLCRVQIETYIRNTAPDNRHKIREIVKKEIEKMLG